MLNPCTSLEQLSANGNWDDVFYCLNIDANSTIELRGLRVLSNEDDSWLDDQKATTNSLEVILTIILLFDRLFYLALLWYLLVFGFKFLCYRGLETLRKAKLSLLSEKPDLHTQKPSTKGDGEGSSYG